MQKFIHRNRKQSKDQGKVFSCVEYNLSGLLQDYCIENIRLIVPPATVLILCLSQKIKELENFQFMKHFYRSYSENGFVVSSFKINL